MHEKDEVYPIFWTKNYQFLFTLQASHSIPHLEFYNLSFDDTFVIADPAFCCFFKLP